MRIFTVIASLLIPAAMLIGGVWMRFFPPKNRNGCIGFRTELSRASQEAWDFAQQYSGRLWIICGAAMSAATGAFCILYFHISRDVLTGTLIRCVAVQLMVLFGSILLVEKKLKDRFHERDDEVNKSDKD